ncbi:MAG TPA: PP2C family protein-serine/threonine phosphatase, partial [Terracidiphilus sp.]|nr:PP2C family protein-serine/threonine phosphatase [Terracidiphilus sp.]
IAVWFLLIALLGLKDHPWLARWSRGLAIAGVPLVLVDTVLMTLEWAPARVRTFLVLDIVTTIPLVFLEGWGIVIVWVGLRRRLDRSRLFLAISALLVELVQLLQNMDLGARWTHWDTSNWTAAAVVRVAGSPLTVTALLNLTFLIAILYSAWRYIAEADARQRALEQEYHSAQELQQVLVPEAIPALTGCTVASVYRPAQEVGGDFFQVIPQEGGGVVVIIGDVSGHGLHAAMTVALIVGAIRSTVETTQEPAEILTALNRRLHGRLHGGFATCLAARVDAGGNCMIANAGHLPPFLNGKEVELEPALPLGIAAEAEYRSAKLKLEAGSRLTLYTDGVLEARNAEGELFGFERVREWSARRAEEIAAEAQRFGQEDDITVLTLEPVPVEVAHA